MDKPARVLLVDEDAADRTASASLIRSHFPDVEVIEVAEPGAFQQALSEGGVNLVISEVQLSWSDRFDIFEACRVDQIPIPIILLTHSLEVGAPQEAQDRGLGMPLIKPAAESLPVAMQAVLGVPAATDDPNPEGRYQSLFDGVPVGLFRLSIEGVLLDVNLAMAQLLGAEDRKASLGLNLAVFFTRGEDRAAWEESLQRQEEIHNFEAPLLRFDGKTIWVWNSLNPVRSPAGQVMYFDGSLKDITERINAREKLHRMANRLGILREIDQAILAAQSPEAISKATLQRIQQLIPCTRGSVAVFEKDKPQALVFATYGQVLSGMTTGALISADAFGDRERLASGEIVNVGDIWREEHKPPWYQSLINDGIRAYLRVPLIFQDSLIGALILESDKPLVFNKEHEDSARAVADSLAIAIRQAKLTEEVHRLAITDELTGLFNRRQFFELGKRELGRALRYRRSLSVIMIDIDHFKKVNDSYGHAAGDLVLQEVARRCTLAIRDTDILARIGGEEFAILLPETNLTSGRLVAERLRRQVAGSAIPVAGERILVTVSLGIAEASRETGELSSLLDKADKALYQAKQTGRNRVV